jgi:sucrose-6-phosphate hydrolase SacC (GH32 family)
MRFWINSLFIIYILVAPPLFGQGPIFYLDFNEASGATTTTESVSGQTLPLTNNFDRPERIDANFGQALRFDGYATWLTDGDFHIDQYDQQFTIEAWYATEAFTAEPAAIIQHISDTGGFSLQVNPYGRLVFTFFFDGNERTLTPNRQLSTYEWHHIVATVDGEDGQAVIYVDGEVWLSNNFTPDVPIDKTQSDLWVGKTSLNLRFAGFPINALNGAIDELKVYDRILSETEIRETYASAEQYETELFIDPDVRHAGDYLRPRYHPMPNTSWTNEPYGLTYYDGKYHLFFQKNPNGPYLYFMHWGHLSSPDLVTWKEEPIALAPFFGFDSFGVWSGTTILDDEGEPVIFYTGVDGAKAGIGSAYPLDSNLIEWEKNRQNPLIPNPPVNFFSLDFRDPYLFRRNDTYHMIVGSGLANNGGGILFTYSSTDLENWELEQPLFQSRNFQDHGTFWEMPAMFALDDDTYAVVVTPQFPGRPADVIYWTGTFDGEVFEPYQEEPGTLEILSEKLLAPAFGKDEKDEWTYIGIIPDDRDVGLQIAAGWRHTFSIPRQLRLLNDKQTLASVPHPNLCRLRLDTIALTDRTIMPNSSGNLPDFSSNQGEIDLELNVAGADLVQVHVLKSADGSERTSIILDRENNRVGLDRRFSSPYPTVEDIRFQEYVFNASGEVSVRAFIDHSVLEIFIDDLVVFSARVYPAEGSRGVDILTSGGPVEVLSFRGHQLGDKSDTFLAVSCPAEDLPDGLYTSTNELLDDDLIGVFPNPTNGHIQLSLNDELREPILLRVYRMDGQLVYQSGISARGDHNTVVPLQSDWPAGTYFLTITTADGKLGTKKIIKK